MDFSNHNFPVAGLISYKEMVEKLNLHSKTIIHKLELETPDSNMTKLLDLTDGGKVWKVCRVRQINGKKIILDKDYFKSEFVTNLRRKFVRIRFMDISKRNSDSRSVFLIRKLPWSHAVKKINNYWTLKTSIWWQL